LRPSSSPTICATKNLKSDNVKKILITIFVVALLPQIAIAQMDDEYFAADQLLRQQKYEQAAEKFQQLHDDQPFDVRILEDRGSRVAQAEPPDEHIQRPVFPRLQGKRRQRPFAFVDRARHEHLVVQPDLVHEVRDGRGPPAAQHQFAQGSPPVIELLEKSRRHGTLPSNPGRPAENASATCLFS